jgi:antitoxin component of MazEF toxin-antitoxin module
MNKKKTKTFNIGNSRRIKISNSLIKQNGKKYEVELEVNGNEIKINSISRKRKNWDSAFRRMAEKKEDKLLDKKLLQKQTGWDNEEWKW